MPQDNWKKSLITEFVPIVISKGNGFANFRKKATRSVSVTNRLEELTLPKLKDIETNLKKFIKIKENAESLLFRIKQNDIIIDSLVFKLYDLKEKEALTILETMNVPEKESQEIIRITYKQET